MKLRAYCLSGLTTRCRELYSSASGNGYFMGSRLDWAVDGDEARIDPFTRTSLWGAIERLSSVRYIMAGKSYQIEEEFDDTMYTLRRVVRSKD